MKPEEREKVRRLAKFPKGGVELSDFTFKIQPQEIDPKTKVALLESQEEGALRPQPFLAAADELRRKGEESQAKIVEIEWRRRAASQNRPKVPGACPERDIPWYRCPGYWMNRAWSAILRWTVGYGFEPSRLILWSVGVVGVMSAILVWAPRNAFAPGKEPGVGTAVLGATETFLPLVQLGPAASLTPSGTATGVLVAYAQAGVSIAGWILAAVFIAGVAGIVKQAQSQSPLP